MRFEERLVDDRRAGRRVDDVDQVRRRLPVQRVVEGGDADLRLRGRVQAEGGVPSPGLDLGDGLLRATVPDDRDVLAGGVAADQLQRGHRPRRHLVAERREHVDVLVRVEVRLGDLLRGRLVVHPGRQIVNV